MLDLLRRDPELLAIADAIVATQVYDTKDAVETENGARDRDAEDVPE